MFVHAAARRAAVAHWQVWTYSMYHKLSVWPHLCSVYIRYLQHATATSWSAWQVKQYPGRPKRFQLWWVIAMLLHLFFCEFACITRLKFCLNWEVCQLCTVSVLCWCLVFDLCDSWLASRYLNTARAIHLPCLAAYMCMRSVPVYIGHWHLLGQKWHWSVRLLFVIVHSMSSCWRNAL